MTDLYPRNPSKAPNPEVKSPEGRFEVGSETIAKNNPNEDTTLVNESLDLYAIFDGAGGHEGGADASKKSAREIRNAYQIDRNADMATSLAEASKSIKRGHATAAVVKVVEGSQTSESCKIQFATVGDSRVYIINKDGSLRGVTTDNISAYSSQEDRTAAHLKQARFSSFRDYDDMTEDEWIQFNRRNIIYASMGGDDPNAVVYEEIIHDGDLVLITSDGVHDNLTDAEILELVNSGLSAQEIASSIAQKSKSRSKEGHIRSKPDDTSVLALRYKGGSDSNIEGPPKDLDESENEISKQTSLKRGESIEFPLLGEKFPMELYLGAFKLNLSLRENSDKKSVLISVPEKSAGEYLSGMYLFEIPISEEPTEVVIGRNEETENLLKVNLPDTVSREHIIISLSEDGLKITDTSTNGTEIVTK